MESLIRNISDTARWVAVYRADESERLDAVFKDPYARMLAGERGEQIVHSMGEGRLNSWSFVARTYLFDQFILQHVHQGYDMIVNLACGLDTRPYRLALPSTLQWIDIDLPDITDYMKTMMANEKAICQHERIALDLANREDRLRVFSELSKRGNNILIVSEGLVIYLEDDEVGTLAYDLAHMKNFKHWVFDIVSPSILPMIQGEMGSLLVDAGTPLKFAPEEGEDFFRLFGWEPIESKSKLKEAALLKRLSNEMMNYASLSEPEGYKRNFPWSGVCLFENRLFQNSET